ncbi:MAG: hypothetical protein ACYSWU_19795, partial [Planctomycetota bacterium]|jgi:hypothetical protein
MTTILETFRRKKLKPTYFRSQVVRFEMEQRTLRIETTPGTLVIRSMYGSSREDAKRPKVFFDFATTDMSVRDFEAHFK